MSSQLRLTLLYAVVCTAWILFSDSVVFLLLGNSPNLLQLVSSIKGVLFVIVTGAALFALLDREFRLREAREQRLTASEQQLEAINRTLKAIINASPIAIYLVDDKFRAQVWSPAAELLFGWKAEEIIGKTLDYVPTEQQEESSAFWKQLRAGERLPVLEITRLRKEGTPILIRLATAATYDHMGNFTGIVGLAQDITAEREAHTQLEYQANLLQNVSDAIVSVDLKARVTSWNHAAERLYGWTADEVMGKPMRDFVNTQYINSSVEALTETLYDTGEWHGEIAQTCKDGRVLSVQSSIVTLKDANGQAYGAVAINRDMTWQQELYAEMVERQRLQQDLDREQEMRTVRNRFVSMVSHEFRTPLAAIQSSADILSHYNHKLSEEKRQQFIAQIQDQVRQVTELLNDFLMLSRMEAVNVKTDLKIVDVAACLREAVESVQLSYPARKIDVDMSEGCPELALDRKLIRQAFMNLMSNALKYSTQGTTVNVTLTCSGEDVRIEVRDQGIGVPKADQERLFEPFFRASNVGEIEGTGLGLAIVRRAVEVHGGTIAIDSTVGVGTAITLMFSTPNGKAP